MHTLHPLAVALTTARKCSARLTREPVYVRLVFQPAIA